MKAFDPSSASLVARFHDTFGGRPAFIARAPGRVNLIGEHTDYNGGWVLPMAIDRQVAIAFRPWNNPTVELLSLNYGEMGSFDPNAPVKSDRQKWLNFPQGVAWALREAGHKLRGMCGVVAGDVPIGAGLSSSAAFEVASALTLCAVSDIIEEPARLARLCQRAENDFVGAQCGIMDQYVSLFAGKDGALLIDCAALTHEAVPLPIARAAILVCDTGVERELVTGEYNARRAECQEAMSLIASLEEGPRSRGIRSLREMRCEQLGRYVPVLGIPLLRRVRHVVSENRRVHESVEALKRGDVESFGRLINASHESLRHDYEVSCPELDAMVEIARRQTGTLGARMVGGGFGGCTVNLVRPDAVERVRKEVADGYRQAIGREPATYIFQPAQGAHLEHIALGRG